MILTLEYSHELELKLEERINQVGNSISRRDLISKSKKAIAKKRRFDRLMKLYSSMQKFKEKEIL